MNRWTYPSVLLCSLFIGCTHYLRPVGEWAEPVELRLHNKSMNGVAIEVGCGQKSLPRQAEISSRSFCRDVARVLEEAGADVTNWESPADARAREDSGQPEPISSRPPDFEFLFLSGESSSDYCGWSLIPFIMFVGFWPCVADIESDAEIRINGRGGQLAESHQLKIVRRGVYGVPALLLILFEKLDDRPKYVEVLPERLVSFVRNKAYNFSVKQRLRLKQARRSP